MFELLTLILAVFAFGALRPRWSSLGAAVVFGLVAAVWVFTLEDIPGYSKSIGDLAWSMAFGAVAAVPVAAVSAAGVVLGRKLRG